MLRWSRNGLDEKLGLSVAAVERTESADDFAKAYEETVVRLVRLLDKAGAISPAQGFQHTARLQ